MQKIYHKTMKVIYQLNKSYEKLIQLSEAISIYQRHLTFLVTETYESTSYLIPQFLRSLLLMK